MALFKIDSIQDLNNTGQLNNNNNNNNQGEVEKSKEVEGGTHIPVLYPRTVISRTQVGCGQFPGKKDN